MRLSTDIDANQAKRIFEILYEETDTFAGFSHAEVEGMA